MDRKALLNGPEDTVPLPEQVEASQKSPPLDWAEEGSELPENSKYVIPSIN